MKAILTFGFEKRNLSMGLAPDKILDEALGLSAEERLRLVDRILASLHLPTQHEIDQLWSEESERRVAEIEKGDVKLVPGKEVFTKIRQKYAR